MEKNKKWLIWAVMKKMNTNIALEKWTELKIQAEELKNLIHETAEERKKLEDSLKKLKDEKELEESRSLFFSSMVRNDD